MKIFQPVVQAFFFKKARPKGTHQPLPWNLFFDSPKLSVSLKSKSIAQQNTPALQALHTWSTLAGYKELASH